jgi:hypothetical protein
VKVMVKWQEPSRRGKSRQDASPIKLGCYTNPVLDYLGPHQKPRFGTGLLVIWELPAGNVLHITAATETGDF